MSRPVLLVAHGTADPGGRAVLESLRTAVATRMTGRDVRLAFVDVIRPTPREALLGTTGAVLVPLFLASGYHVSVDVPEAVATADGAFASRALGPDPLVVEALSDRVHHVAPNPSGVVLAAAGSSREAARAEVTLAGERLSAVLGCPVVSAFLGGSGTTVAEAVTALPAPGRTWGGSPSGLVVASYLLAPGFFQTRASRLAADHGLPCTEPIGVHPRLLDLILQLATTAPGPPSSAGRDRASWRWASSRTGRG